MAMVASIRPVQIMAVSNRLILLPSSTTTIATAKLKDHRAPSLVLPFTCQNQASPLQVNCRASVGQLRGALQALGWTTKQRGRQAAAGPDQPRRRLNFVSELAPLFWTKS